VFYCGLWGFSIVGFLLIVGCGAFWFACGASSTLIESCLLWGFPLDLPGPSDNIESRMRTQKNDLEVGTVKDSG
jgi:hypothetical protein